MQGGSRPSCSGVCPTQEDAMQRARLAISFGLGIALTLLTAATALADKGRPPVPS